MLQFEWIENKPSPLAHIELDEDDTDSESLGDCLRGAESVGNGEPSARLTIALVTNGDLGPLGPSYPRGFGIVTTLHDFRAAVDKARGLFQRRAFERRTKSGRKSRAYGQEQLGEYGLSNEPPEGILNRFINILTDDGISHPENVTDIWIENTNYRRSERGR